MSSAASSSVRLSTRSDFAVDGDDKILVLVHNSNIYIAAEGLRPWRQVMSAFTASVKDIKSPSLNVQ